MYYIFFVFIVAADQLTKILARNYLASSGPVNVLGDFFRLNYVENTGMAFSILAGSGSRVFLVLVPAVIVAGLLVYWKKTEKQYRPVYSVSVMMIAAGGLSNIFDRVTRGSVTDFFDLKWFAVFNVADIAAVLGCFLLVYSVFFAERKEK